MNVVITFAWLSNSKPFFTPCNKSYIWSKVETFYNFWITIMNDEKLFTSLNYHHEWWHYFCMIIEFQVFFLPSLRPSVLYKYLCTFINMTTPNFKYFLVIKIKQFSTSKRPGLNDFCLFLEMEESLASEACKINF